MESLKGELKFLSLLSREEKRSLSGQAQQVFQVLAILCLLALSCRHLNFKLPKVQFTWANKIIYKNWQTYSQKHRINPNKYIHWLCHKQEACRRRDQWAKPATLEITLNWWTKTTVITPFCGSTMSQRCSQSGAGGCYPAAMISTQSH